MKKNQLNKVLNNMNNIAQSLGTTVEVETKKTKGVFLEKNKK